MVKEFKRGNCIVIANCEKRTVECHAGGVNEYLTLTLDEVPDMVKLLTDVMNWRWLEDGVK